MESTEIYQKKHKTTMRRETKTWKRWLLVGTMLVTMMFLLQVNPSHGAVIKRENGVQEQELMAKQMEMANAAAAAAAAPPVEPNRLDSISRARAIDAMRNANRISTGTAVAAGGEGGKVEKVTQRSNATTNAEVAKEREAAVKEAAVLVDPIEELEEAAGKEDDVEEAVTEIDDTPIPTFAPFDINRYTSSYHDDGVAESESLRERDGNGGSYTTVDYEQRFDRIELTTPAVGSGEQAGGPYGMFRQEAHRFDSEGMRLEEEDENASSELGGQDGAAAIVNLDGIKTNSTAERNSTAYFNNVELESTKYDIQADEAKQQVQENPNPTTKAPPSPSPSQKRGKYLQNPEEATVINSESNEPNFSLPSTADVWALAAMKNVEQSKTRAGVYFNNTSENTSSDKKAVNGTNGQTKILTDWLEIMKNSELATDKFLGNDIPAVREQQPMEEAREENKVVEVVVTPPATSPPRNSFQRTTSVRRFDEQYDTTTEFNFYRATEEDFRGQMMMTGGGEEGETRVSDNLYYDDFTTDLPDFLTTTESPEPTGPPVRESNVQRIKASVSGTTERPVRATTTTTMGIEAGTTATTMIPRNEINTVPNESSFDRKTTEAINNIVLPLESTSLSTIREMESQEGGGGSLTMTTEKHRPNSELSLKKPSTGSSLSSSIGGVEEEEIIPTPMTTEEPPRIIPLIDAGFATATTMTTTMEKKEELEQQQPQKKKPSIEEEEQQREEENKEQNSPVSVVVVPSTLKPTTDITNNSIEKSPETSKAGESNSLPEYTIVEQQQHQANGGGGEASPAGGVGDTTGNNNTNGNYIEVVSTGSSQSNAPTPTATTTTANNDHEDDEQHNNRPDYVMTTTTKPTTTGGVTRTAVRRGSTSGPTTIASSSTAGGGESGEEGAAAAAGEQSNIDAVDVVPERSTRFPTTSLASETIMEATKGGAGGLIETKTTMSPERIELETRRTNGHQVVTLRNDSLLEVSNIGAAAGAAGEATADPEGGRDVNAIIAITVSVIAVVALVLLVGFLYVMRKRQKQLSYGQRCQPVGLDAYSLDNVSVYNSVRRKNNNLRLSKRSYGNSAFEDPGLKFNNLSIQGLAIMVNNKDEIHEEFKEIPSITARVDEVPPGCEDKNRYANVVPLPETRVHLKQLNGDEKTEYINASYVRGPKDTVNYYIACQAPMDNTIVDFWRMIWEQNSKVVCQLTDLTENGIEKCAEYLPPSAVLDTNRVFGDFSVTLKNREVKDKYAVSTIHLRNAATNTWREITHFWYQWPEEGMPIDETSVIAMLLEVRSYLKMAMPEQTGNSDDDDRVGDQDQEKQKKILELNDELTEKLEEEVNGAGAAVGEKKANGTIDKSKSLQRTQGPLTVHCSPGTGRTGTIIGCDIALRSLEMKNRSVDVPQIVYYVRRGRASSIKTRDQYEFIYRCSNTYAQKLMEPIVEN